MSGTLALFAAYFNFMSLTLTSAFRIINVNNNCPISVDVFFSGVYTGFVDPQDSLLVGVDAEFSGTVSVDADAGTSAGFFLDWDYYYIIRNTSAFNIGVSIAPADEPPINGYCGTATCDSPTCVDAFSLNLNISELFDPVPGVPPVGALHGCDYGLTYNVTWCPSGTMPDQTTFSHAIHPLGDSAKCLDVRGNVVENGTAVQVFDCNDSDAQRWIITRGNTQVRLANSNFCLDAGTDIENGVAMKIWECIPDLAQQLWFYTNDDRIAVVNHGQCLDVPNGDLTNSVQLQTSACINDDSSQFFTS